MEKTKDLIKAMLVENTGTALLDSGDYYGRHWQQNRSKTFEMAPDTTVDFSTYGKDEKKLDICVSHNIYHWLVEKLERTNRAEALEKMFLAMAEADSESGDAPWLRLMEDFAKSWLPENLGVDVTGIYGEGEPLTINTHNGEDLLSQTIQYTYFEIAEGDYAGNFALLQIHGGCDVRGGYTAPKMFELKEELGLMDNARASIYCPDGGHRWYTDDGCHFYPDHNELAGDRTELEKRGIVELEPGGQASVDADGKVPIDESLKQAYCPHCAGKLSASFY